MVDGVMEVPASSGPGSAMFKQYAQGLSQLLLGALVYKMGPLPTASGVVGRTKGKKSVSVGFDVRLFDFGQVASLSLSLLICKMRPVPVVLLSFCSQGPKS